MLAEMILFKEQKWLMKLMESGRIERGMKKVFTYSFLAIMLLAGCQVKELETEKQELLPAQDSKPFIAIIEDDGLGSETRTTLDNSGNVLWKRVDRVSIFAGSTVNECYQVTDESEGKTSASLIKISGSGADSALDNNVALYPYCSTATIAKSGSNYVLSNIVLPATQTYAEDSFGNGAFPMAAVTSSTEDMNLRFKNVLGGLKLQLKGSAIIYSISITGNNNEILCGDTEVTVANGSIPSVNLTDASAQTVTLECPPGGVALNEETATSFIIALPPITMTGGFTVVVSGSFGGSMEIQTTKPQTIIRSGLLKMPEVRYEPHNTYAWISDNLLPSGVDKTSITEAYFHSNSDKTTDTLIPTTGAAVYFELDGTVAHYYTPEYRFTGTSTQFMFKGWTHLKKLDLSNYDFRNVTSFDSLFEDCYSLEDLNLGSFENQIATTAYKMFYNCRSLKSLDLSGFQSPNLLSTWKMFEYFMSLTSLNLSGFTTDNVTNMSGMFCGCKSLATIDVSSLNTSRVTDMSYMFAGCSSLASIDLSSFDTSSVENIAWMFGTSTFGQVNGGALEGCSSLRSIDLSNWNTEHLQNVGSLFYAANSLTDINLAGWNAENIVSTNSMFAYCTSLKSIDLSDFRPTNLGDIAFMFDGCLALESLNISGFGSSNNISSAFGLFHDCVKLKQLDFGNMDLSSINDLGEFLSGAAFNRDRIAIRCNGATKDVISQQASLPSFDLNKVIWVGLDETMPTVSDDVNPDWYYSTDFSKDKTVKVLQEASVGEGVNIVIFGDAYSDRLIADGTYENDITTAVEGLFSYEPMKSFRDLFNVYMVYAVSTNEVYSGDTAVRIKNSRGSQLRTFNYAKCAAQDKLLSEVTLIVIGHDPNAFRFGNLGMTVTAYGSSEINDFGNAVWSCEYVARIANDSEYIKTVVHEFGHTFAKLADEYISKPGYSVDDWRFSMQSVMDNYGFYKNIDFTNNLSTIKWSTFINDARYSSENLGAYEGATFDSGVWRPDYNSIMRDGDSFNAPSREAIYYRIHKLAYGRDWQYDYETFVQQDLKNIPQAAPVPAPAKCVSSSALVNRHHFFKMEESFSEDGKKIIIIMQD